MINTNGELFAPLPSEMSPFSLAFQFRLLCRFVWVQMLLNRVSPGYQAYATLGHIGTSQVRLSLAEYVSFIG